MEFESRKTNRSLCRDLLLRLTGALVFVLLVLQIALLENASLYGQSASFDVGFQDISIDSNGSNDPSSAKLEAYLRRLKLNRLVIKHLENEVAQELNRELRLEKAGKLASLYSDELFEAQLDSDKAGYWMSKVDALVRIYPELDNPRLKIATLQARYLTQERKFRVWWNSSPRDPRGTLQPDLKALADELVAFNSTMEDRYEELVAAIQASGGEPRLNSELEQVESLLLHSSFLAGWSAYFYGIIDPDGERWLQVSDKYFRDFLQIEPRTSLTELSEKWFDFNSQWHIRALVGLAMCHRGLGHPEQSEHCFQLLKQNANQSQNRLLVWKLNSRLYNSEIDALFPVLAAFKNSPEMPISSQVSFWVTVLNASVSISSRSPNAGEMLKSEALAGLTRAMQAPVINDFLTKSNVELKDDFLGNWVSGYLSYHAAKGSTQVTAMQDAKEKLTRAIEVVTPLVPEPDVARCRYLLARILYRERNFEIAAELLQSVAADVVSQDRELAAESQWLAAQSLIEISRTDSRKSELAYAAIDSLIRRFPQSNFARRAEFEKMRLDFNTLPGDEVIRRLDRIEPGDRKHGFALDEKTRTRYRLWIDSFRNGRSDREQRLDELLREEKAARSSPAIRIESKLKLTLLVIDALLRYQPVNEPQAKQYRAYAETMANQISPSSAAYQEFRYYQLSYSEVMRLPSDAKIHAKWLLDNAAQTRFERPALVYFGRILESELRQASGSNSELEAEVIAVYRRLVQILGTDEASIRNSGNAQVALAKLAEMEFGGGNFESALETYSTLVTCFPNRQQYLHGLAKTRMKLNQFELALPIWRKLGAGVEAGSDLWYESKYQLVTCVRESNPAEAARIYRQTIKLSRQLPEKWRLPFQQLEAKLVKPKPSSNDQ